MKHLTVESFESAVIDSCNETPQRAIYPGASCHCEDCVSAFGTSDQSEMIDEGGFSYSDCECCGSSLGGDRYAAHSFSSLDVEYALLIHWDICIDCRDYLANGELPQHLEGE